MTVVNHGSKRRRGLRDRPAFPFPLALAEHRPEIRESIRETIGEPAARNGLDLLIAHRLAVPMGEIEKTPGKTFSIMNVQRGASLLERAPEEGGMAPRRAEARAGGGVASRGDNFGSWAKRCVSALDQTSAPFRKTATLGRLDLAPVAEVFDATGLGPGGQTDSVRR